MIKLERLYSAPEIFTPIKFDYGVNIIMGEKSESDAKKIGVGKSLSIEFLNFCLFKRFSESRLSKIPKGVISNDTKVCLDLRFNGHKLTIVRLFGKPNEAIIYKDGEEINFDSIDIAVEFMTALYFEKYPPSVTRVSFRSLLGPIIRDERSEFKDIIKSYDTIKLIPRDYRPHLFYLGLNVELYSDIVRIVNELERVNNYIAETKKILTNSGQMKMADVKAHVNELDGEVSKISDSIEQLKNNASFDIIQADIVKLESLLYALRNRQKGLNFEIKQINSLPEPEHISDTEIGALFNEFKKGLGDKIIKSIDETRLFKERIDSFRNTLVNSRLELLRLELTGVNKEIDELENDYTKKMAIIDGEGVLKNLKTSLSVYNAKTEELNYLNALVGRYENSERQKKSLQLSRLAAIAGFDESLIEHTDVLRSFQETILGIHERVMGNREAYFAIETNKTKESIEFILRTDNDGSHTTERIKVFIYDSSLMFNWYTANNHPGFLVHDNLFDKDDDSLSKCLNFMYRQAQVMPASFQYILTLNRDLVESITQRGELIFSVDEYKCASFTKESRFLKYAGKYTEDKKGK